jgi:hypothetical protein
MESDPKLQEPVCFWCEPVEVVDPDGDTVMMIIAINAVEHLLIM